jgi:nicotinamidase-related amidase
MAPLDERAALLLVDIQAGFEEPVWGERNNPDAEERAAALLAAWRESGRPVVHVRHLSEEPNSPLRPGQPGAEIQEAVRPVSGEPVVEKSVNSAFIGTGLEERLRAAGIETLVIAGLTTDHCVSTTARMAANLGFETYVVSDATATFGRVGPGGGSFSAEQIHEVSLASLHGEFATVTGSREVLGLL